jgi:hypothetical protein
MALGLIQLCQGQLTIMPLSSRDVEEIHNKPFKKPWYIGFFIAIIRLLAKIPYINNKLNNSSGGLSGRIFSCWERKDYKKATQIAIDALERFRHKKDKFVPGMEHQYWWQFMKLGVDSAKNIEEKVLKDKLISMANG